MQIQDLGFTGSTEDVMISSYARLEAKAGQQLLTQAGGALRLKNWKCERSALRATASVLHRNRKIRRPCVRRPIAVGGGYGYHVRTVAQPRRIQ